MPVRALLLLWLVCSVVCVAQTPAVCPWFSTGSAAVVLGGPVVVTAKAVNNGEGTCRFTRQGRDQNQSLAITIGKQDTHACPQGGTRLIALGNEAVQCTRALMPNQHRDVVAGRMRDVFFAIELENVATEKAVPVPSANSSDLYAPSMLERVAEQVVGNLY